MDDITRIRAPRLSEIVIALMLAIGIMLIIMAFAI